MSASMALRTVIQGLRFKFPSVKNVTTATLRSWMAGETSPKTSIPDTSDAKSNKLIIVDARPELEYRISHIAESINVNFETEDMDLVKRCLLKETGCQSAEEVAASVVLYCSVGYRSSILTEKILKATQSDPSFNYWQFFNLEGSIFKWVNENGPVVDEQGEVTNYVHPFDKVWGRLIDKDRWKSEL